MTMPFHLALGGWSYLRALILTSILIFGSQSSFAAHIRTYPVSGVWVAMDHQFPESKVGACWTLKTMGVDALFGGPFPTVMIFSDRQRFVVRGGHPAELAVRSVNSVKDGGFRITESIGKHRGWLPWFKNRQFHLKVIDPMLIEIAEGPVRTRFFKCSSSTPL